MALPLLAAAAVAQTTGQIEGTVADEGGAPLPGAIVQVASPALQGNRDAATDASGDFRLVFLPPGVYTVRCTFPGFTTAEQEGVVVGLGRTVTLRVRMQPAFTEEVSVNAESPTIDVRSTEVGANVTKEFFLALPMQRDYAAVAQAAPGLTTDASGPVAYGSSGRENVYFIDGINTTGTYANFQIKSLNFEFIEEVQVKAGGYQAEFGNGTGGVINVITRSGANDFHGDVFAYYFSDALQGDVTRAAETYGHDHQGSFVVDSFAKADAGLDVGGFILKDRLWFFAAYNRVVKREDQKVTKDFSAYGGPEEGAAYADQTTTDLWAAKLTATLGVGHWLVLSAFGDPAREEGPIGDLNGEESTFLGTRDTGGNDATLQYQGVFGTAAVVDAQVSRFATKFVYGGPGAALSQVADYTTPLYAQTGTPSLHGGLGGRSNRYDTRDAARLSATFFAGHLAGDHEIRAGADAERVGFDSQFVRSGGQYVEIRCARGALTVQGCPDGSRYFRHFVDLTARPPGGALDADLAAYVTSISSAAPKNENLAAYIQDAWRPSPDLTLNLGVRWDRQQIYDNHDAVALELADEWAPRLGFVWDFSGKGAAKLFGSVGRFYQVVPLTLSGTFVSGQPWAATSNRDPSGVACDPALHTNADYRRCNIFSTEAAPVDPSGVSGEYMDEALLGVEVSTSHDLVLGAKLVYRDLGPVIEDSLTAGGAYYIGNPGYGLLTAATDQSFAWAIPVPFPRRTFTGVELSAAKRMSNAWQLLASYLWSRLEGTFDGNFSPDVGGAPNVSPVYDFGEFSLHSDGYLGNDRRHQAKVSAVYMFPFRLTAGATAYYRSGTPVSALGFSDAYEGNLFYLTQRGAWGRTAAEVEMDLHVGYSIRIGGAEINLLLDVFHLLDRQGETARDQAYNLEQTVDVVDYATGEVLPAIAPGTACASLVSPENAVTCNSAFNSANAWQDPRSIRLGVRVTF